LLIFTISPGREHAWFQAEFVGGLRLSSTLLGAW